MLEEQEIHLLLSPKERFCADGAGAFALNVAQSAPASCWRGSITVFGTEVRDPFSGIAFRPLKPKWRALLGRNIGLAERYIGIARTERPALIEVFNRPAMALWIARRVPHSAVAVYLGNDPREMRGSRTAIERRQLAQRCAAIYCVSAFIRACFLEGIDDSVAHKVHVVHTGAARPAAFPMGKEKRIVFVGRMLPLKGALQLAQALAAVLPRHPDWRADLIGAPHYQATQSLGDYEKAVLVAAGGSDRIILHGFLPNGDVLRALRRASIAVVPSCWDDPFPRTAVEALSQGCALICGDRGGLREVGHKRALMLSEITPGSLAAALERLIANEDERLALQHRAWSNFPFDIETTTRRWDELRTGIVTPVRAWTPNLGETARLPNWAKPAA